MNPKPARFDYDVAVLGGGSAGYAAARTAAAAGLRTVVLESGAEVGGLCILRGCMPTKALLYAAEVLHLASHAEPWGIRADRVGFDFAKVMARWPELRARSAVATGAPDADDVREFAAREGIAVIAKPYTTADLQAWLRSR